MKPCSAVLNSVYVRFLGLRGLAASMNYMNLCRFWAVGQARLSLCQRLSPIKKLLSLLYSAVTTTDIVCTLLRC